MQELFNRYNTKHCTPATMEVNGHQSLIMTGESGISPVFRTIPISRAVEPAGLLKRNRVIVLNRSDRYKLNGFLTVWRKFMATYCT
ncbi:hypothetical protein PM8797T_32360 [Gimesia maris DSM 8797]|uniref:Uncharacterized protein n=1 Tax=Gimesia maris TaxID=122 RepID=A0ABX5YLH9_9PLAN|nr:hypothetical protein PM8797T_32360 [Gimesia maris DSM 8797]QDT79029.1 hypothetical protein Mal35_24830 [Gimesia maris]QEG16544.1 hypothetical protein GmarT_24100 [Gimesia maris]